MERTATKTSSNGYFIAIVAAHLVLGVAINVTASYFAPFVHEPPDAWVSLMQGFAQAQVGLFAAWVALRASSWPERFAVIALFVFYHAGRFYLGCGVTSQVITPPITFVVRLLWGYYGIHFLMAATTFGLLFRDRGRYPIAKLLVLVAVLGLFLSPSVRPRFGDSISATLISIAVVFLLSPNPHWSIRIALFCAAIGAACSYAFAFGPYQLVSVVLLNVLSQSLVMVFTLAELRGREASSEEITPPNTASPSSS
jgi:hypothetical protein